MKKIYIIWIILISLFFVWCSENTNNTEKTGLSKFEGKPTILIWGSTWCPHCINSIPVFEKDIYKIYEDKINIQINTLSKNKFETKIPQVLNSKLTFKWISSVDCNFIPSWIILDKNTKVIDKSCWGEKTLEDLKKSINLLLKK